MRLRAAATFAVVVAALVASGCRRDDYRPLAVGECLPERAEVVGIREASPPTVPCSSPHRYEVYGVGVIDDDLGGRRTFPAQEEVDAAARQVCYELFEPGVGFPAAAMGPDIEVVYLAPSPSSWMDQGDRDVECLLVFDRDRSRAVSVAAR